MKVLFVGKIDPWCSTPCGIRGYFRGLIKPYSMKGVQVTLLGVSSRALHKCLRIKNPTRLNDYRSLSSLIHPKFEHGTTYEGVRATESLGGIRERSPSSYRDDLELASPIIMDNNSDIRHFSFVNVSQHKVFFRSQVLFSVALNIKSLILGIRGFFSDFDLIHVQRIDQALPFIFFNKPVICTLHGKGSEQALEKNGKFVHLVYTVVERFALSRVDYAIAVSDDIRKYYVSNYPWCSDKISVVGNGVDTSVFKPRNKEEMKHKYGFSTHEKIILYLGRFHEEKNLELLLLSFERLLESSDSGDIRLVLVGEGNTEKQISTIIKDRNLTKRVTVLPPVSDAEVPEILCCADVFALTSIVEGFPLVILQALACGVPVVSTDVGEIQRVVKNYETGFLVDNFSAASFADCLKMALINTNILKENAILVAKKNSWDSVAYENIDIYNIVLMRASKQFT